MAHLYILCFRSGVASQTVKVLAAKPNRVRSSDSWRKFSDRQMGCVLTLPLTHAINKIM